MHKEIETETHWARIYIAGPLNVIEQVCREYVFRVGLCVTVTPTKYIFTGGEETGVEIGLINYPRFPSTHDEIKEHAIQLAHKIMNEAHQGSYTVMTSETTYYYSRRDEYNR